MMARALRSQRGHTAVASSAHASRLRFSFPPHSNTGSGDIETPAIVTISRERHRARRQRCAFEAVKIAFDYLASMPGRRVEKRGGRRATTYHWGF